MIRNTVPVVTTSIRRQIRRTQHRGAIKRRRQPRDERIPLRILARREGACAAAEDVGGGGSGEVDAGEAENVTACGDDFARDGAEGGLRVYGECVGAVFGPHLGDVVVVVAGEEGGVRYDAVVWA